MALKKGGCEHTPSLGLQQEFYLFLAGAILVGNRGVPHEIDLFGTRCDVFPTARDSKLCILPPRSSYVSYLFCGYFVFYKHGSFYIDDRYEC